MAMEVVDGCLEVAGETLVAAASDVEALVATANEVEALIAIADDVEMIEAMAEGCADDAEVEVPTRATPVALVLGTVLYIVLELRFGEARAA